MRCAENLKLDGIGLAARGHLNELEGSLDGTVVVNADLGDDECGSARNDAATGNGEGFGVHEFQFTFSCSGDTCTTGGRFHLLPQHRLGPVEIAEVIDFDRLTHFRLNSAPVLAEKGVRVFGMRLALKHRRAGNGYEG